MQPARHFTISPPLQRLNDAEQLVTNSLCGDWIVRVEHADGITPVNTIWRQWGETLFAVKDSGPVIDSILSCRASHPRHAIRLHAEKARPEVRFIYCVYRPEDDPAPDTAPQVLPDTPRPDAAITASSPPGLMRNRWHILITLLAMLLVSALVAEEAVSATLDPSTPLTRAVSR